jgi:sirohydrochlorin cobaltochelatase
LPVNSANFTDAVLAVLGHGTTLNAESAAPVYQHAAELRRRGLFAEVREAFWKQSPRLEEVLTEVAAARVFIVPLFISEGYFSEVVIPRALEMRGVAEEGPFERVRCRGAQTWFYCRPVGTHESMTGVLLARAREVAAQFPFPAAPRPQETTLVIAGHGTEKNENSRKAIEQQVERIRASGEYGGVHAVFLDESPHIGECYELAAARNLIVVPFFISDGLHVQEDIPVLLGESERVVRQRLERGQASWRNPTEKHGKRVWYARSVGTEPLVAEVILARVQEAGAWAGSDPLRGRLVRS